MDAILKLLADVGLALDAAETALDEGAAAHAEAHLDAAAEGLDALRMRWPGLAARERAVLGAGAQPLRARLDAARARLPRRAALTVGAPERDPDEERDPEA